MNLTPPSEPSRRRSRLLSPLLLIILGSISGTLSAFLSFTVLNRTRTASETNRVAVRLKKSAQNVHLSVVGARTASPRATQAALSVQPQAGVPVPMGSAIPTIHPQEIPWNAALRRILDSFQRVHHRLQRFTLYRHYAWAILPLIVVTAMHVNSHLYYDTFRGYDMPPHFVNMYTIMRTGALPPRSPIGFVNPATYEAYQSPLFYVLTAWIARVGEKFSDDGYAGWIPGTLFLLAVCWTLVVIVLIQGVMRRISPILKGLTLCVVMLLPVNVLMATMYNNDLPATILIIVGIMILWFMLRSGRQLDRKLWLRFAAVAGISTTFKNNGVILLGVSILLAGYIGFLYLIKHRYGKMARVGLAMILGLPMMLVPYVINVIHTIDYTGNQYGAVIPKRSVWGNFPITFFTTFDTTIFDKPYAFGPGDASYWSLQYVTLHQDYYNSWGSRAFNQLPLSEMIDVNYYNYIPLKRFNNAILLQYLAIPITLIMVFGFLASLFQVMRRPYRAIRDGSILIVILAIVTEGAQFLRFSEYADVRAVIIHARFLSFMFMTLFIVGVIWLWRLWARRLWPATVFVSMTTLFYCFVAYQLLWLPPI